MVETAFADIGYDYNSERMPNEVLIWILLRVTELVSVGLGPDI